MEQLSFPQLGISFNLNPIAFTIGNISIYWYGIIISAGFLLAMIYTFKRFPEFGVNADRAIDVIIGGVVGGIVGARLYYVMFSWDDFKDNLADIFAIRSGGIAIYGGIIGAFLVGALVCKIRKVKILPMLDVIVAGFFIGQGIGRWGNFVNIEAFGSNTTLPWGMTSNSISYYLSTKVEQLKAIGVIVDPSMPVHPTFLYESIWCLLGFVLVAWYTKKRLFDGELGLIYVAWYGLGRSATEGLRTDSLMFGTLRVSQVLAVVCFVVATVALFCIRAKIKSSNDPEYLKLYVNTEEAQLVMSGEYYKKKPVEAEKDVSATDLSKKNESLEPVAEDNKKEEGENLDNGSDENY